MITQAEREGRASSPARRWAVIILMGAIPFLGYVNFRIGEFLLGLRPGVLEGALSEISPESKPLFLAARDRRALENTQRLLVQAGFDRAVVKVLPQKHELEIPLSWIRTVNPYPPLLAEFAPGYEMQWSYLSFGYLDDEGWYRQVTSYGGEADTTPSFLVPKARGEMTGGGDYFVSYLFRLSREIKPQPW